MVEQASIGRRFRRWSVLLCLLALDLDCHAFVFQLPLTQSPPTIPTQRPRRSSGGGVQLFDTTTKQEEQAEMSMYGATNATTAKLLVDMQEEEHEYALTHNHGRGGANTSSSGEEQGYDVSITEAPPLSFQKFLTMQGKRVVVSIRYSGEAGLKPYFLTAAKKIKASHPDVILERRQMADIDREDPTDEPCFEILVDGKVVVGNTKSRSRKKIGTDVQQSIFVSMQELDLAISRARRRRRPSTTVYGEVHEPNVSASPLRLDGLRQVGGGVIGSAESPQLSTAVSAARKRKNQWKD